MTSNKKNHGLIWKAKNILLNPKEFFNHTKKEEGIKHSLKYLLVFLLLTQIFFVLYYFKNEFSKIGLDIELNLIKFLIVYIILTVFMVIYSFVRPAIINFFIRWFTKEHKFQDTYKALVYGITPDYIGTPFFIIAMILFSANMFLNNNFLTILFVISAFIVIITTLYTCYLRILGVSKFHKISMFKAFLCIYIFPLILLVLVELMVITLFVIYLYFTGGLESFLI